MQQHQGVLDEGRLSRLQRTAAAPRQSPIDQLIVYLESRGPETITILHLARLLAIGKGGGRVHLHLHLPLGLLVSLVRWRHRRQAVDGLGLSFGCHTLPSSFREFNLGMLLGGETTSAAAASHTYLVVIFCFDVVINFESHLVSYLRQEDLTTLGSGSVLLSHAGARSCLFRGCSWRSSS